MYSRHILPKILSWIMSKPSFVAGRRWCVSQAEGKVLEIGFGDGANLSYYDSEKVSKIYALEPSKELLGLSESRNDIELEKIEAYAENIPLEDKTIDTVLFTWTMCSVDEVKPIAEEIHRILKDDGKLIFVEHGKSKRKGMVVIQTLFTPIWSKCMGGCKLNKTHWSPFDESGFIFKYREQKNTEYKGIAVKK